MGKQKHKAKNVTDHPIDVDEAGHQLAAGEIGQVDPEDPVSEAALEAGQLVKVGEPKKED